MPWPVWLYLSVLYLRKSDQKTWIASYYFLIHQKFLCYELYINPTMWQFITGRAPSKHLAMAYRIMYTGENASHWYLAEPSFVHRMPILIINMYTLYIDLLHWGLIFHDIPLLKLHWTVRRGDQWIADKWCCYLFLNKWCVGALLISFQQAHVKISCRQFIKISLIVQPVWICILLGNTWKLTQEKSQSIAISCLWMYLRDWILTCDQ